MISKICRKTLVLLATIALAYAISPSVIGTGVQPNRFKLRQSFNCPTGGYNYYCSATGCRDSDGTIFSNYGIKEIWANFAHGKYGCRGGDCGFWGGCRRGYCNGYYNFQGCSSSVCYYGPFQGYGCNDGHCSIVCLLNICQAANKYDKSMNAFRPAKMWSTWKGGWVSGSTAGRNKESPVSSLYLHD